MIFTGGASGSYSVIWKDSLGNTIPNTIVQDGDTYTSKIANIKSSNYLISVFDANYTSTDPQTNENKCGCTDTLILFVGEPQALEVNVGEYHYVTCNGDSDGAIVAHAKGGRPFLDGLPYTYQWVKLEGGNPTSIAQLDSIISGLAAGFYRVKVIDRNNIEAISADYHLVEPEPLTIRTKVLQNIGCSGDSVGIIQAIAGGGTAPYEYIWSTNDTTSVIRELPEGKYVVGVRDARYKQNMTGHYCFAQTYGSIVSPNPIQLNPIVKQPACSGYSNGSIFLRATGGTAPYSYRWGDGTTELQRSNLGSGEYHVRVTDSTGCFMDETFSLEEPAGVIVNLGRDIVLCKDQTLTLNGDIGLPDITYEWTDSDGKALSSTSSLEISKSGIYRLTATTLNGCTGMDEIKVDTSEDEVNPEFIVSTKVANNSKIYAVNITQSTVDSIVWILPNKATVLEKTSDRVQLEFAENGKYSVAMTAYRNQCSSTLYKTVEVVDKSEITEDTSEDPFVKRFVVTPNPNDGTFQALVELREPADYTLTLYDSTGKLIMAKDIKNKIYEASGFDVTSLGKGVYYLKLISSKATSVFNVLIK